MRESEIFMIIIAFAVAAVAVLIVGFIGNKISDGITNAVRSNSVQRQQQREASCRKSESLTERYRAMQTQSTRRLSNSVPPQVRFCTKCGQPIGAGAQWCHGCGARVDLS